MSLEIACTACGAELEVESGGAITQCPACGIDLEIPNFDEPEVGGTATSENLAAVSESAAQPTGDQTAVAVETAAAPIDPNGDADSVLPSADDSPMIGYFDANQIANFDAPAHTSADVGFSPILGDVHVKNAATIAVTHAAATPVSSSPVTDAELARLKSRNRLLVSYASAVTLAAVCMAYMLYTSALAKYRLESLPDLAPPVDKNGNLSSLIYVPSSARLPPLHELRIGESRQFGVVRVTPLRVTRGPLQFVRYDGNKAEKREPSAETLQLHLRLENMSRDQTVVPLDSALVYARETDSKHVGRVLANQFVQVWRPSAAPSAASSAASSSTPQMSVDPVVLYDLPIGSIWDIAGQNLGRAIGPGEVAETFVASSEERLDELRGDLQWRLHFRKGHNADSGRGVTTLVDIRFQAGDIQPAG